MVSAERSFSFPRVLKGWISKLEKARLKDYDGLRLTDSTIWLGNNDWKKFTDYEREVDELISRSRMIALCTYSLDKCKAYEIIDIIQNHHFALINRNRRWEILETSKHKRNEENLKRFATFPFLNPNPVLEVSSSGNITFFNNATLRTLRKLKLKKDVSVFLPEDIDKILKALNKKKEKQFYREIKIKESVFGEILYLTPQFDAVRIYATDITERKKKEAELHRLNRTLRALSNSAQTMLYARNEQELLEEACRIIIEVCGHKMVWIGFAEDDEHKTVRPVAYAGFEEGYLKTLNITWADTERGRGPNRHSHPYRSASFVQKYDDRSRV